MLELINKIWRELRPTNECRETITALGKLTMFSREEKLEGSKISCFWGNSLDTFATRNLLAAVSQYE